MNVEIICIGTLKETWLREAEKEYVKRLKPFVKINITELSEKRLPNNAGPAEEEKVRYEEGKALIACAEKTDNSYIYVLDMRGRQYSSESFAEQIQKHALRGKSTFVFIIGGSLGLHEDVRKKADEMLSFSEMTFPHQMTRIILLEQIYRGQKISRGEPYHK